MAEFFKNKNTEINPDIFNYFYLNDIHNYQELYIINNKDYDYIIDENRITPINIISKDGDINDKNTLIVNIQKLNTSPNIYLKESINYLLNEDIKNGITSFNKTIICNIDLINYLKELNLISDIYTLNNNTYLKIDKYNKVEIKSIK